MGIDNINLYPGQQKCNIVIVVNPTHPSHKGPVIKYGMGGGVYKTGKVRFYPYKM